MSNEVVVHLFKQMSWANHKLFIQLSELPTPALECHGANPEWNVANIATHIVHGQGRFIARAQSLDLPPEVDYPHTSEGMRQLAEDSLANDAKLLALIDLPDTLLSFVRRGEAVQFMTTTVLASVVHHSTEHRTQIADILAFHNMDVINLDQLDQWTFAKE